MCRGVSLLIQRLHTFCWHTEVPVRHTLKQTPQGRQNPYDYLYQNNKGPVYYIFCYSTKPGTSITKSMWCSRKPLIKWQHIVTLLSTKASWHVTQRVTVYSAAHDYNQESYCTWKKLKESHRHSAISNTLYYQTVYPFRSPYLVAIYAIMTLGDSCHKFNSRNLSYEVAITVTVLLFDFG